MAKNVGKKARRAPELAGRVRDLLIAALDLVDDGKSSMTELLAAEIRQNPIRFLELTSKFVPKDVNYGGDPDNPIMYRVEQVIIDAEQHHSGQDQDTEGVTTTH